MRTIVPFNHHWLFMPDEVSEDTPDTAFELITLPHTNKILPHHNFDVSEYTFISTYRKRFTLPEPRNGRRVYIDFEGAMIAATLTINGHTFEEHRGGYTPFSFDITDYLNDKEENLLEVRLDSTERKDIPPFGFVVDYLTFGGIYREVSLRYIEPVHIDNVFVWTEDVLEKSAKLHFDVRISNQGTTDFSGTVECGYGSTVSKISHTEIEPITVTAGQTITFNKQFTVEDFSLWTLESPTLSAYQVQLSMENNSQVDRVNGRFGFRDAIFRDDGFYLNEEKLKLRGLNRHQSYPYIGYAAPARLQRHDADTLKYELGLNIVRTSHYPQSRHFLDRCDEIGLLVFEEIPGWQHIGDDDWKSLSLRDVRVMIENDRNHPSIILWGVRINESQDDEAFYDDTNNLARQLDPTRQTGGVRYFLGSQFIEDVYTFNDFSNTIVEPEVTPHLVTEYMGHMFPTKTWDQEERLVEHATRHAHIQDKSYERDRVAGAIGWCAFDYNTHREFGSGDRICYHGVMDMFRQPKWAAYLYASQVDPSERIVLKAATMWTMGDRSEGGNDPVIVFSNCDEIEAFMGTMSIGRFEPDRSQYPHLPHPPFTVSNFMQWMSWGMDTSDFSVVGYIDGEQVAEQRIDAEALPLSLELTTKDTELFADGRDMTWLMFRIVDQYGNRLPYTQSVISFTIDGPAELIGDNPFPLMGGQAALLVRAGFEVGEVMIKASAPLMAPAEVMIKIQLADIDA